MRQLFKLSIQPHTLCEKFLNGWRSLLSFSEPLSLVAQSLPKSFTPKTIARAFKAQIAGILALVNLYSAKINRRILVGLVVMYVGATLFYFSYTVFDRERHILGWYHHNYWHLFFLIRYQISQIIFLIGFYIGLPQYSIKKAIAPYLGFLIMGMVLNITAESNDDIWDTMSLVWWLAGTAFSVALFLGLDHVAHRKYHRADSFDARQKGLYQIADSVDAEKWKSMMMETLRQKYEFNEKF